jgi:predicted nucleic acid-binding protein
MNNLIESSAWIEYFKGNKKYFYITDLINNNAICTNEIILAELLPSIIHKKENKLADLLNSLKKYYLTMNWYEILNLQVMNLKYGNNNIGIPDIIIVQNCMQNNLKLITNDKHFYAMAKYLPLNIY